MFIELLTIKQEQLTVNVNRIEYFTPTKKGTLVVFTDGLDVEIFISYDVLKEFFNTFSYDTRIVDLINCKNV